MPPYRPSPVVSVRCIAQELQFSEPGEKCTAIATDTTTRQHAYGASALLTLRTAANQLTVGAGWDHGSVTFLHTGQYGYLNTDGISVTRIPFYPRWHFQRRRLG